MPTPAALRADNFTPPQRTPWGGRRILSQFKRGLPLDPERAAWDRVGESWEVSVEPDFPSRLRDDERCLEQLVAEDPEGWLGPEVASKQASTALLLKLLDAAEPLSVQIHPADDDPRLDPRQSGKPEAWYVVARTEGAGIYLGLRPEADEEALRETLRQEGDLSRWLQFHPVEPGDVFVVPPGTPHAIGPGLTLVEPQRVLPGRRGVTWRYWDWNRRYDASGQPDPRGAPRPLHVEEALAVTDWAGPRGERVRDRFGHRAPPPAPDGPVQRLPLVGPDAQLTLEPLRLERWSGTGALHLPPPRRLLGLLVLEGAVSRPGVPGPWLRRGEPAVWPATEALELALDRAVVLAAAADR